MSVTLGNIQSDVLSNLGLASGDVTLSDVTHAINQAYAYDIPIEVGGNNSRGEWSFSTTASTGSYAFSLATPGIVALDNRVIRDNTRLTVHTNYDAFWGRYDRESTSTGAPSDALIWNRTLYLRPIPDAAYTIYAPGTLFRTELSATADVIDHSEERAAIAARATYYFGNQVGYFEIAAPFLDVSVRLFNLLNRQDARQGRSASTVGMGF